MWTEIKRIIVARTDRIGDVVLSLPVFASLKKCHPRIETIALVQDYTSDVVSSSPYVDSVVTYDPNESIYLTTKKLVRVNADAILFLFPRFRLSAAALLAGIRMRVGTAYRWYSFLFNTKVHEHRKISIKHEAEYNLALAEALGCREKIYDIRLNPNEEASNRVKAFLRENNIERFVIIHPGSGGSAFEWGQNKFRQLVESIIAKLDMKVIVTGTSSEFTLCKNTSNGIAINTAGRFSLLEFIALLSEAEMFISNSTGSLHLAAAVGTAVIGIYPNNKPMTPVRWAPLIERKIILTPKDGSDDLSLVSVNEVMRSVLKLVTVKTHEE